MHYFARVTAGLEQITWQEIEQQTGATFVGFGHRRIDFFYEGAPADLLALKSVDDVYLFVAQLEGFDRTRASLRLFNQLNHVDFTPALETLATIRELSNPPTYAITASHLGKRNYSRYDVEDTIHITLFQVLPWRFIPNRPDEETQHDIDLRVLIEEDWALIGIRLSAVPLHRRPYKTASRPGSLKAPVAFCLAMLANIQEGDAVLDPTCGAGTILIEAANLTKGALVGIDIEAEAIAATQHNSSAADIPTSIITADLPLTDLLQEKRTLTLIQGDAREIPLAANTFQSVITNLPWGKQVEADVDLQALYSGMVALIARVLVPGGRAVILTDQLEILQEGFNDYPNLILQKNLQISLFGSHPTIHILSKSA